MHTTAFWLTLGHSLLVELPFTLSERQSGIFGLLYALGSMATLLLMCDWRDLGTAVGERPPSAASDQLGGLAAPRTSDVTDFFEPNLYLYDAYPAESDSASRSIGFRTCCWNAPANSSALARAITDALRVSAGRGPKRKNKERRTCDPRTNCAHELAEGIRGHGFEAKVSQVMQDRFRRLKALRPPSLPPPSGLQWQPAIPHIHAEPSQVALALPDQPDRLAQILGASAKTNQYGDHLSLHCWFGEPARFAPDLRALQLLVPDAPGECGSEQ